MLSHFCITNEATAVILNTDKKHQPNLAQKFFRGEDENSESYRVGEFVRELGEGAEEKRSEQCSR